MLSATEEESSAQGFKIIAFLVLIGIAFVGGLMPLWLKDLGNRIISGLNTAAGGVFFASALVHMLPESSEILGEAWKGDIPWGHFFCAAGFLLVLCVDQAVTISQAGGRRSEQDHVRLPSDFPSDTHRARKALLQKGVSGGDIADEAYSNLMSAMSPTALLESAADSDRHSNDDSHPYKDFDGLRDEQRVREGSNVPLNPYDYDVDDELPTFGRNSTGHRAHGNGHSHSHGLGDEQNGVWVRLALLLALSIHSVMEGLGLGARSDKAYSVFLAIAMHKGLAAYALGASLLQSGVRGRGLIGYVSVFSMMTPLGILIGAWIEQDGEDDVAGAICVATAAGTFLYVSLMEVLPPELGSVENGWMKMIALLGGFTLSAVLGLLAG